MSPEKMDLEWLKQKDKNLTKMTIPCSCSCTAFTLWFLKLQHQITVKCSTQISQASSLTIIHKIIVPIVKMLIKELLCSEGFLAETTAPFIYIKVNLMLLLFPKHVITRMKSTFAWEFIFLFFHKGHQILHRKEMLICHIIIEAPMHQAFSCYTCFTSSIAFQAARLLSLEQCT